MSLEILKHKWRERRCAPGGATPWGYTREKRGTQWYLIPDPYALDVLEAAKVLLANGQPTRICAEWMINETSLKITHQGFINRIKGDNALFAEWSEENQPADVIVADGDYGDGKVYTPKPNPQAKPKNHGRKKLQELKKAKTPEEKKVIQLQHGLTEAKRLQTRNKKMLKKLVREEGVDDLVSAPLLAEIAEEIEEDIQEEKAAQEVIFEPNPGPQTAFLAAPEDIVFYGGARGGGKSYALMADPLRYCHNGNFRGLFLRRTMPELREIIRNTQRVYPKAYPGAKWSKTEKIWTFPSGAQIEFGYAESEHDAERYRGQSYTWAGIDELPQYPDSAVYDMVMSSLRSPDPDLPVLMRCTGNPGNVGCVPHGNVWTVEGWKPITEVREGDLVWSVDANKQLVQKRVTRFHEYDYDGPLVKSETSRLKFTTTPNHRFPELIRNKKEGYSRFDLREFTDLSGQATILRTCKWEGTPMESFTVPHVESSRKLKLSQPDTLGGEDFAFLLGLYLAEGYTIERDKAFGIAQKKAHTRVIIEELLTRCGFTFNKNEGGYLVYSEKWYTFFKQFGNVYHKYIAKEFLATDKTFLKGLLEGLMIGDGSWTAKGKRGQYYTSSSQLKEDVIEVLLKLGYKVQVSSRMRASNIKGREVKSTCPNYEIVFSSNKSGGTEILTGNHRYNVSSSCKRKTNITQVKSEGKVYCLTVEDTETFFLEQEGCIWVSGNSPWVKEKFIDPAPPGERFYFENETIDFRTNEKKVFRKSVKYIPATLYDNPHLTRDDSYIATLASLPEIKRKQMLEGNWDVIEAGAFPEFERGTHVIEPFRIPDNWLKFRAADWGFSSPFCCLWFAVDFEDNFYVFREWYGQGIYDKDWANQLAEMETDAKDYCEYGVIDGSVKAVRGSTAVDSLTIINKILRSHRVSPFKEADRSPGSRKQGKLAVHRAMALRETGRVDEEGRPEESPGLFIFNNCTNLVRTLPQLLCDPNDPEIVLKKGAEDHAYDALQYGLRSYRSKLQHRYAAMEPVRSGRHVADSTFGY